MSCPICGELCRCAEPRTYASRTTTMMELDEYDRSEEQFSSSLAGREAEEPEQELASGSLSAARKREIRDLPDVEAPAPDLLLTSSPVPDESWRQEVSSRIQNYKARRRRSLGDESLSFNFESTTGNHVFLRPEVKPQPEPPVAEFDAAPSYYPNPYATAPAMDPAGGCEFHAAEYVAPAEPPKAPEPVLAPEPPQPPAPPETAKLIFFPRPPMMQQPPTDQLAEPVFDVPRIVEAPEATEPVMVPLADITLQTDPEEDHAAYADSVFDLPTPVAPVERRVFAELLDSLFVLSGTAIFAGVASRFGAGSVADDKRALLGMIVLVPALFWAVYKYIFLVHAAVTPGMQAAHVHLVNFDGATPRKTVRRYRALAMLVSAFPLGLGLIWSFVDPETLCWHDRISKTYVTAK